MNSILVSIIVPVYNAERYLEQCVESLCAQTHTNIEIIIINDGSTDSTANIMQKLSKADYRVKICSKSNAGVSAARNDGLDMATGEYVCFVDADDYLANDFVEYMLELAEQTGAEFCLSKSWFTKKDEQQEERQTIEALNSEDATALLLSPEVIVGCCNKMYKRDFIERNKLRFLSTLFYGEGLHFITMSAQAASVVGVGNRKVYYYRRNNELSATTKFDINKMYNGEKAIETIDNTLKFRTEKVNTMLELHRCMFALGAIVRVKANRAKKQYSNDYKRWLRYLRANVPHLLKSPYVSLYRKLLLFGGCILPSIVAVLDIYRRKRIVRNSVE